MTFFAKLYAFILANALNVRVSIKISIGDFFLFFKVKKKQNNLKNTFVGLTKCFLLKSVHLLIADSYNLNVIHF